MIDPRELRIGNLVFPDNFSIPEKPHRVALLSHEYIHISGIDSDFVFSYHKDKISPIPLTPEWLERAGWKHVKTEPTIFGSMTGEDGSEDFWIGPCFRIKMFAYGFQTIDGVYITLKYVHQLQNLYFALTGKELEIKTP